MPALRVQTTIVLSLVCINMYVACEQVLSEVGKKNSSTGFQNLVFANARFSCIVEEMQMHRS